MRKETSLTRGKAMSQDHETLHLQYKVCVTTTWVLFINLLHSHIFVAQLG